jgi:hypothetical protein
MVVTVVLEELRTGLSEKVIFELRPNRWETREIFQGAGIVYTKVLRQN